MTAYAWTPWVTNAPETTSYWDSQSYDAGVSRQEQNASTLGAWDVSFKFTRSAPAGIREDAAYFGLRIGKQISGFQVGIGLLSELATIEALLDTFSTTLTGLMSSQWSLVQYIWHERRASHPAAKGNGEKTGPAIRYTTKSLAGGVTNARMADQIAVTVTFKTASRKHWGRVYLPGLNSAAIDAQTGRITNAYCDSLALPFRTLLNALDTAGYVLGVWSYPKKAFMGITQLQVDNVPDVQRRRRAKQRSYAKTYTS